MSTYTLHSTHSSDIDIKLCTFSLDKNEEEEEAEEEEKEEDETIQELERKKEKRKRLKKIPLQFFTFSPRHPTCSIHHPAGQRQRN